MLRSADALGNDAPPSDSVRGRVRVYLLYGPLFVLLFLWIYFFAAEGAFSGGPSGRAFGADYAMFVTAAQLLHQGANPYDHARLLSAEDALMHRQQLPRMKRAQRAVVRVGNPPLLFWLLEPLDGRPFQPAAYAWIATMYAISVLGLIAALVYTKWRQYLAPTVVFLLMPPVVLGAFYGNVVALVFGAAAGALLLLNRYPVAAGALLAVSWLKPQIAIPVILLYLLFQASAPRRVLTGFVAASLAGGLVMLFATGTESVGWWLHGLIGYSRDVAALPDLASLSGLYVGWAPHSVRLAIEAVSLLVAAGLTWYAWHRSPAARPLPLVATAWLWFAWLLATPYAHYFDLIMLTIPIAALIGPEGYRPSSLYAVGIMYLMFLTLFFINPVPSHIYLLPIPTLLAGVLAYRMRDGGRSTPRSPYAPT